MTCRSTAGHKSLVTLSDWCENSSQELLARLGARISPSSGLRIPPSYATIQRTGLLVDAEELDLIVNTWAAEQADRGPLCDPMRPAPRSRTDPTKLVAMQTQTRMTARAVSAQEQTWSE